MVRTMSTPLHASTWTPLNEGAARFGVGGDADGQPMSALRYRLFKRVRRALVAVRRFSAIHKIKQSCGLSYSPPLTIFTIISDAAVKFAMSDVDTDRAPFASAGRQAMTTELCNVPTHDQC